MIRDYAGVYRGAWRYMLACPLLFAVPAATEFVQHAIEVRIGMYDSFAAAQAVEGNGARLGWGLVKTLSITLAGFWVARFLLLGGAAAARRAEPVAVRLYAWVMLFSLAGTALGLWGGGLLRAVGLGDHPVAVGVTLAVLSIILSAMLAPWRVGAALGNAELGFVRSLVLVGWRAWWGVILIVVTLLPLMIVHYALLPVTIVAGAWLKWPLLALDSVVVGGLAAVIGATDVAIARRAVEGAGRVLSPQPAAPG